MKNKLITRYYVIFNYLRIPIYIGLTTRTLKQRFKEHIKTKHLKDCTIDEIAEIDHGEIDSLEKFRQEQKKVQDLERLLIKKYLNADFNLLNISKGGEWGTQILHKICKENFFKKYGSYDGFEKEYKKYLKYKKIIETWKSHRTENKYKKIIMNWILHKTYNKYKKLLYQWKSFKSFKYNYYKLLLRHWIYHKTENKYKQLIQHWIYHRKNNQYKVFLQYWIFSKTENKYLRLLKNWKNSILLNRYKKIIKSWICHRKNIKITP